jgi:predicted HicB family RNase H-like nuclease
LPPDLHRRIAAAAARERKSVNAFIADALDRVA